jgi:hypothetical protein
MVWGQVGISKGLNERRRGEKKSPNENCRLLGKRATPCAKLCASTSFSQPAGVSIARAASCGAAAPSATMQVMVSVCCGRDFAACDGLFGGRRRIGTRIHPTTSAKLPPCETPQQFPEAMNQLSEAPEPEPTERPSEQPDAELMGALRVTAHLYLRQRQREGADVSQQRRSLRRREGREATYTVDACSLVRDALQRRPGRLRRPTPRRTRAAAHRFRGSRRRAASRSPSGDPPGEAEPAPGRPELLLKGLASVARTAAVLALVLLAPGGFS